MKRVLVLDAAIHPRLYRPTAQWRSLVGGVALDSRHLPSGETVPDLDGYTHLIVTGSEGSIVEHEPWYDVEAEAIRDAVDRGIPILASCFGHQMLAVALSGPQYVRRSPTPSMGWIDVAITAPDPLMDAVDGDWGVFVFHFDEVVNPPDPWRVLASTERCPVHVMRYGDLPVWGIQAHPEITPDEARALMKGYRELRPDRAEMVDRALAGQVRDDGAAREITRRFLEVGQGR